LFGTIPLLARHHTDQSSAVAMEILSVAPESLLGGSPTIFAFDVSPDGKAVAVEFIARDGEGNQVSRVGEWDIPSKKMKTAKIVEGPAKDLYNPQFEYDLRFTPDGRHLIALTGPHILVLDATNLTAMYAIGLPPEPDPPPEFGWFLDSFGISGDGRKLAVISRGVGPTCGDHSTFRLFDLMSGESLSSWRFIGCTQELSLSKDGTRAFLGVRVNQLVPWQGEMVDATSGKILRTFPDGGGFFLDDQRVIKGENLPYDPKPSDERKAALAIVNVNTGKVEQEMHYKNYGLGGSIAVAPAAGAVAVMESWLNPRDLARDATYARGFVRLLLFHVTEDEPFYASADIHDPPMVRSVYMVRISSDGRVVAYGGRTVHVVLTPVAR
jgi:hypothetical protein